MYCKRCLQFLGQKVGEGIKIWNENVTMDGGVSLLGSGSGSLLGNFQNLIRKIVHDFEYVDKFTCLLPTMHKLLVKSFRTESSQEAPNVSLLVQVMDMGLDMFQWQGDEGGLKRQRAMKLLYCFQEDGDQMLKYWENDQNVHPLPVSPKMFQVVWECLKENAQLVPEVYRHNYGFDLSYLFVEEE